VKRTHYCLHSAGRPKLGTLRCDSAGRAPDSVVTRWVRYWSCQILNPHDILTTNLQLPPPQPFPTVLHQSSTKLTYFPYPRLDTFLIACTTTATPSSSSSSSVRVEIFLGSCCSLQSITIINVVPIISASQHPSPSVLGSLRLSTPYHIRFHKALQRDLLPPPKPIPEYNITATQPFVPTVPCST
jgi:hypothetical protein